MKQSNTSTCNSQGLFDKITDLFFNLCFLRCIIIENANVMKMKYNIQYGKR